MRGKIITSILALLIFGGILTACNPVPTCTTDHRGWVRVEKTSGPYVGESVALYLEWTSSGWGSECIGAGTWMPREYPNIPNGCNPQIGSCNLSTYQASDGSQIFAAREGVVQNLTVWISNYKGSGVMYSGCFTDEDVSISCLSQHVT